MVSRVEPVQHDLFTTVRLHGLTRCPPDQQPGRTGAPNWNSENYALTVTYATTLSNTADI